MPQSYAESRERPVSSRLRRRGTTVSADLLNELDDLVQAVDIQQVRRNRRGIWIGGGGVVSPAHGNRGVEAAGESHDQIRISASTDTDHLDLLTAKRMMGMGDGHPSRRWLG